MVENKKLGKTLATISLGVVLILLEIWILTQVPEWKTQVITLIVITAFVFSFGSANTEKVLLRTAFLRAIPKMFIFAGLTFVILYGFGRIIGGSALPSIASGLASVPISLIFIHGFIVAVNEELIFRGWLADNLKKSGLTITQILWITSIVFAFFHFLTAGRSFILLIPYVALGLLFFKIKQKYSPETNTANMGTHWGWNIFILAFGEVLNSV